jgi:hypothetical protein
MRGEGVAERRGCLRKRKGVAVSGVREVRRRWGGSTGGRHGRAKRAQDAVAERLEEEEEGACGVRPACKARERK